MALRRSAERDCDLRSHCYLQRGLRAGKITGSTLTVTGVGTIVLAANQAGNSNYSSAAGDAVDHRQSGSADDQLHGVVTGDL